MRQRGNKYSAKKSVVDGIKFDSKREARRYSDLKLLQGAGQIHNLELQVKYPLMVREGVHVKSRTERYPNGRKVSYLADFRYFDVKTGAEIVEDVKGFDTPASRIKRACVEAYYGIQITLT